MEDIGPAIADLVASLDVAQLKSVTIEAILEHRRLLAVAEKAYADLDPASSQQTDKGTAGREAYVRAMLNSKAQMAVVAVLVDRLGFVPDAS